MSRDSTDTTVVSSERARYIARVLYASMNAKKFAVAFGSFALLYSVVAVLFRVGGTSWIASIERTQRDRDYYRSRFTDAVTGSIAPQHSTTLAPPRSSQAATENTHSKYNFLLSPEYFALRRPLETTTAEGAARLAPRSPKRLRAEAAMASKQGEAAKRFPTTLIIGVRKAGTRALLAILNIHPQVKSCGPEVHFFDQRYPRGLLWYLEQTPRISADQQTIEKTPSYFVVKDVPQRVLSYSKAINKTLKFLVIFRDPTVRAISDYVQLSVGMKTRYNKRLEPFEEMVMKNRSTGVVDTSWGVVKTGVYSKHLERWFKYFPSDWFHFVSGEQLVKEPFAEIQKVERFLGLKPFYTEKNFVFNPEKGFPCFRGSNERSGLRCLGKAKGRSHPVVDSRILNELRKYYHPFNKQLYKMVHRDFQWP